MSSAFKSCDLSDSLSRRRHLPSVTQFIEHRKVIRWHRSIVSRGILARHITRHGRACPGHPRLTRPPRPKDVDARHEAGHDAEDGCPGPSLGMTICLCRALRPRQRTGRLDFPMELAGRGIDLITYTTYIMKTSVALC